MATQPLLTGGKYHFDDGVHFVRNAYKNDRHPLRFVVTHHKATDSKRKRHVDTLANAIEVAKTFTKAAIAESANDKALFEGHGKPAPAAKLSAASAKPSGASEKPSAVSTTPNKAPAAPKKGTPPSFASSYFTCKIANPTAQVWECTKLPGERKSAGRKRAGGQEPEVSKFRHMKGQCAVLLWDEPVRDRDGQIRVFPSWVEADEHAEMLYRTAYEEGEAIRWRSGDVIIQRLTNVEICFDPTESTFKPFYLVINQHGYRKPYYRPFKTRRGGASITNADGTKFKPTTPEGEEALALNDRLDKMFNEEFRSTGLTDAIALFKTPWEAEKKAIELEIAYCGNGDLYS